MLIELANFCFSIVIAVFISQAFFSFLLWRKKLAVHLNFSLPCLAGLFFALLSLVYSFYISDFAVALVAQNSSSLKPAIYRIASLWASYQGSLFLWLFFISFYGWVLSWQIRKLSAEDKNCAVFFLSCLLSFMALFIEFCANPFVRFYPAVLQGQDLNPLLEDVSLAIHPPLLYLGYASLALGFCLALASLFRRSLGLRKILSFYNHLSAIILLASIISGSYWAYYELGWGGYWAFDPVENYALMPWLASLGAMHSKAEQNKKAVFFPLAAFSLAIIGSFFARTNFVFSVHSFMSNFSQTLEILCFSLGILLPAWCLYFSKIAYFKDHKKNILYYCYVLLSTMLIVLLLAQFIPLFYNLFASHSIYINKNYYYYSFIPLAILAIILMCYASVIYLRQKRLNIALFCGHAGLLIVALSIIFSNIFSSSVEKEMSPGEHILLHNIKITYIGSHLINEGNFYGEEYGFKLNAGKKATSLKVQKRNYLIQKQENIRIGLANFGLTQIYVMVLQKNEASILVHIDYNYGILAIWLGGCIMILGIIFAIFKIF